MDKNDYSKIIEFVKENGFIPKTDLKDYIKEKLECSDITANRKIDYLISQKKLIKINKEEYNTYNIKGTDNRVVYIGLKQNKEVIKYIQDRLSDLKKEKSPSNQKLLLRDISLYKDGIIYSNNINDFIGVLEKNNVDHELNYRIIGIIENLIRKHNILIENEDKLLTILKKILKENLKYDPKYPNLKRYILYILAYFDDPLFLTQLEDDLINESGIFIEETYFVKSIAECIDKNKEKLNKLQIKFNNKGLKKQVDLILQIRYKANENLGLIESKSSDLI
jgi:hypothetical protein